MRSSFRVFGVLASATALLLGVTEMTGASAADAGAGGPAVEVTPGAERHWMRNFNSAQCLAVPGGSTQQGTGLIQWPCGNWHDQSWSYYNE
ncbi:hypothetical protein SMD11_5597 [Streptomyces albireticuli]|uniref:Uncharacterized protein n=1 Tax=Streptomyces albireticuli TaxID=1940 RepID=A0A1Z2LA56_9ACTN|nr:hypothetical protein [Streptomyces albireticuli]ARZ71176.1 hypothetical protein SMD11_5597 [Streptomyces albireticuli]